MSFQYNTFDTAYSEIININLFRFHIAKTKEDVYIINELFRKSSSFSNFKNAIFELFPNYDIQSLQNEYSYAVNACLLGSTYWRLKGKSKLFPYWRIDTIRDREYPVEFDLIDGIILSSDLDAWNSIFPPNFSGDISYVTPCMAHEVDHIDHHLMNERLKQFQSTTFWKECTLKGFGINRAIIELANKENEQYLLSL
ncbi:hypothetical protein [Parabacteroides chinchillae]|uniref:Uncharacterized protein n=1 Tax=Parabacteroides chinchillae TaxID=871327 RepID=A0A8G2BWF8_9BACT|nr:hypothetical protein [Parabacteroides chinchillae]SEF87044.1 hypothetical protein SAMN05444001_108144 [Parabacteroides chinchillae]